MQASRSLRRIGGFVVVAAALGAVAPAAFAQEPPTAAEEELRRELDEVRSEMRDLQDEMHRRSAPTEGQEQEAEGPTTSRRLWDWIETNIRLSLTLNTFFLYQAHTPGALGLRPSLGTWSVAQVEVDLWSEFEHGIDFRFDLDFAEDDLGTSPVFPDEFNLEQGFIEADLGKRLLTLPIRLTFGRWNAPIGFEGIDAPVLWQFSRSNVASFLTPQNLNGVKAMVYTDIFDAEAWLSNGWEGGADPNFNVDGEIAAGARLALKLLPQEMEGGGRIPLVTVRPAILFGHSGTNLLGPAFENPQNGDERFTFDTVFLVNYVDRYHLALEINAGHESNIDDAGGSDEDWVGVVVSANAWVLDWFGVTLRGDYLHDEEGTMTGAPQYLRSFTTALLFKIPIGVEILDEFHINLEWRYDRSNLDVFADDTVGGFESPWRSQFAVQVFFAF